MPEYLIYLNDSKKIQSSKIELIEKCKLFTSREIIYTVYNSYTFIDGTGFARKVKDEISFVINSHKKQRIQILNQDDFITAWSLEEYLDYDIQELSGGWKKYLGLALFSNIKSDGKIYFDACRQLSDRLIEKFISNLRRSDFQVVFYFELDAMLLSKFTFQKLYDSNEGFMLTGVVDKNLETNYE